MLNSRPITQFYQLNAKIRNHKYFMSTNIYYKHPDLMCTEYIAVRSVRRGQIKYEDSSFSVFDQFKVFGYFKNSIFLT